MKPVKQLSLKKKRKRAESSRLRKVLRNVSNFYDSNHAEDPKSTNSVTYGFNRKWASIKREGQSKRDILSVLVQFVIACVGKQKRKASLGLGFQANGNCPVLIARDQEYSKVPMSVE